MLLLCFKNVYVLWLASMIVSRQKDQAQKKNIACFIGLVLGNVAVTLIIMLSIFLPLCLTPFYFGYCI